jgi:hypothetical protein
MPPYVVRPALHPRASGFCNRVTQPFFADFAHQPFQLETVHVAGFVYKMLSIF